MYDILKYLNANLIQKILFMQFFYHFWSKKSLTPKGQAYISDVVYYLNNIGANSER